MTINTQTMPSFYTVVQNIDGEIKTYGEESTRLASQNFNIIANEYSKYALEWIHHSLKHCTKDDKGAPPPVLLRLSDMAELCSAADVMSEAQSIHNEYNAKLELHQHQHQHQHQLKADYDEQIKTIATKMMAKGRIAMAEEGTASNTLYNIIQETGNDEFMICGKVIDNGSNSLEYHKQSYAELALKWFPIAVKEYDKKWTKRPPVLIRLSDSAIVYSMLDYMPEVKIVYDEFETKMKRVEEDKTHLKSEYIEKINALIRDQVASKPY